ncbi:unnamed protein product [Penicillium olsonii]|nr:unnamed protein product [Penicillium olsonii]
MCRQHPKKSRSLHSKSRSGCGTCKIRHKRCDETHPACLRCTSTGRKCDGYAPTIDKRTREWRNFESRGSFENNTEFTLSIRQSLKTRASSTSVPLPLSSASQVNHTWSELWHLDFYHNCIAVRLSHYFKNIYWSGLIYQMCQIDPAIRHAAMAMSAWHTQSWRISKSGKDQRDGSLSLYHSSRAIACLRHSLSRELSFSQSSTNAHKQVVLVACLMFIVLALFQGDIDSARCHLASGYKLFKEWDPRNDKDPTGLALRQAFGQFHVNLFFCAHSELFSKNFEASDEKIWIPSDTAVDLSMMTPPSYSGVNQMDLVLGFLTVVTGLILDCSFCGFDTGPAASINRYAAEVLARVRLCKTLLTAVLIELDGLSPEDCDSLRVFTLWIEILEIKIKVAKSQKPTEMAYDDHLEQFKHITKLIHTLSGSRFGASDINFSPLNYRCSVLPALLWTAIKCRDWKIRQDICSILDDEPGPDCWTSATSAALKRLIDAESSGVESGMIIPEAARVDLVNVKIRFEDSKVELRYRRSQYLSDPNIGSDGWESDTLRY